MMTMKYKAQTYFAFPLAAHFSHFRQTHSPTPMKPNYGPKQLAAKWHVYVLQSYKQSPYLYSHCLQEHFQFFDPSPFMSSSV